MSATLLLLTIPVSHFCEKARWSLQRAGLAYHEEGHVPVFSRLATRRMGQASSVPFLLGPTGLVTSSTAIARFADDTLGQSHRLFPGQPEVDALVQRFDEALGPHARRLAYGHLLSHRALALQVLTRGVPGWEATALRVMFPLARRLMRSRMKIDDAGLARSRAKVDEVFEEVGALLADGRKYLVGDRFTAADLTFAALAAVLVLPPRYGGQLPPLDRWPSEARAEAERLRATPAGAFAMRMYAEERSRAAVGF